MSATTTAPEKREFKTELKQLLHLITHSLYSNKEIFLRELISNASDAINKIKFDSLDREDSLEGNKDWKIRLSVDPDAGTLTVSDNGIGMSHETAVENLGTIARSGTRAYLEALKASAKAGQRPDQIGQFGVGFYSAFMVADKVTVLSRTAGSAKDGVRWESDGQGDYTIEPFEKANRGTDVILHLKQDEKTFLDGWTIKRIVKKFSDFVEHPIVMDEEKENDGQKTTEEETLNSRKALWLRSKSENTDEEYREFYKQVATDFRDPAKWVHYTAEGNQEYKVLVYLPAEKPFDMQFGDYQWGLKLYIQRVLIMDHCEALLPVYLRFARGVVDSSDLPLNISRELLQDNPLLVQIKSNVTRNLLKALEDFQKDDREKYTAFFKQFGTILKEGPRADFANRERIADLFLFESMNTPAGQFTTLGEYVAKMPEGQKEIYYLAGESREALEHSPYLEAFREKGHDVLFYTDPADEILVIPSVTRYKEKSLVAADGAKTDAGEVAAEVKEKYAGLLAALKAKMPELTDVRLTARLKDSAACLVSDGHVSANMQRLQQLYGRGEEGAEAVKRTLELNGSHPAVEALRGVFEKSADDARVELFGRLLLDQATVAEGSRPKDPAAMAKRINDMLVREAGR